MKHLHQFFDILREGDCLQAYDWWINPMVHEWVLLQVIRWIVFIILFIYLKSLYGLLSHMIGSLQQLIKTGIKTNYISHQAPDQKSPDSIPILANERLKGQGFLKPQVESSTKGLEWPPRRLLQPPMSHQILIKCCSSEGNI